MYFEEDNNLLDEDKKRVTGRKYVVKRVWWQIVCHYPNVCWAPGIDWDNG